jgi:hypothetical protein
MEKERKTENTFQKNLKTISNEVCEFVFLEANKKLKSVNSSTETLDKKSFTICTVLLSLLGVMVSFTTKDLRNTQFIIPYLILIIGFAISLGFLIKATFATRYYGGSFKPSQILGVDKKYIKDKEILISSFLLQWYDEAIKKNMELNTSKGTCINFSILIAFISLLLFVGIYVYLKLNC